MRSISSIKKPVVTPTKAAPIDGSFIAMNDADRKLSDMGVYKKLGNKNNNGPGSAGNVTMKENLVQKRGRFNNF